MLDERQLSESLHAGVDELLPSPDLLATVRAGGRRRLAWRRAGAAVGTLSVAAVAVTVTLLLSPLAPSQGLNGPADHGVSTTTPPAPAQNSSARQQLLAVNRDKGVADYAVDLLVKQCMMSAGFSYDLAPRAAYTLVLPHEYGQSIAQAKTGYHLTPSPSVTTKPPENRTVQQRQAYNDALDGPKSAPRIKVPIGDGGSASVSAEGCQPKARLAVFADLSRYLRDSSDMLNAEYRALDDAATDPRVRWLNQKWAGCMRDKGLNNLPDPSQARALARAVQDEPDARQQEIAIAVADAQCEQQVGYDERERLEDGYFQQQADDHPELAADTGLMYRQARQRAEQILTSSLARATTPAAG